MQPQSPSDQKKLYLVYILIAGGIIIALVTVAATYGARSAWIGHAVTAIVGLVLMGMVIVTGAIQGGRITRFKIQNPFKIHRAGSVSFAILMVGAFILGIFLVLRHGDDPVLASDHGILGLAIAMLAIVQVAPSLLVKTRLVIRPIHMVVGYTLVALVSLQIISGLTMVFHIFRHFD